MVLASHVIFGAYGFWLPNDPRGSWSDFVGAWELFRFGAATTTDTRRSVAGKSHDRAARLAAREALKYPAVKFTGLQARAIGRGFDELVTKSGLKIWACSIMPQHVHLVVERHCYDVEQVVNLLKGQATRKLVDEGLHPMSRFPQRNGRLPQPWARGEWKVFLDTVEDIVRAIQYVENNPLKDGLPAQRWPFAMDFDPRTLNV
jgi:REP element-mobilizing transposase RayT